MHPLDSEQLQVVRFIKILRNLTVCIRLFPVKPCAAQGTSPGGRHSGVSGMLQKVQPSGKP